MLSLTLTRGILDQNILCGGGNNASPSNSKTKRHGNTKFGMLVGVHQNILEKLSLSR